MGLISWIKRAWHPSIPPSFEREMYNLSVMEDPRPLVYVVVVRLPDEDGYCKILGVYHDETRAEARAYREHRRNADQDITIQSRVFSVQIDVDDDVPTPTTLIVGGLITSVNDLRREHSAFMNDIQNKEKNEG